MPSWQHEVAAFLVGARSRLGRRTVRQARWQMRWVTRLMAPPRAVERRADELGGFAVERLSPPAPRPAAVLLYLHGGGYCLGSIGTHRGLAARVALASRCRTLLTDYPLAPEHPFPAALDAVHAVYRALRGESGEATKVFLVGDSAGGGLALALVQRLRVCGDSPVAGVVGFSPWIDLTLSGLPDDPAAIRDPMITSEDAQRLADHYAGEHDPRDPLISPLFGDFRGFPPLLVQVGTRELLNADSRRLVERARAAGVEATLEEEEGLMHAFQAFAPYVPEAGRAIHRAGRWIERRTDRGAV